MNSSGPPAEEKPKPSPCVGAGEERPSKPAKMETATPALSPPGQPGQLEGPKGRNIIHNNALNNLFICV